MCTRCDLCKTRKTVVLARGNLPCEVLFIGEAPGQSEDVIGRPFVGPAGKLLDQIVEEAVALADAKVKCAYTNLVACLPIGDDGAKMLEPSKESIMACQPRLMDVVKMAKPTFVTCVGSLSRKWITTQRTQLGLGDVPLVHVDHPAFILRSQPVNRTLLIQRAVSTLRTALEEYIGN